LERFLAILLLGTQRAIRSACITIRLIQILRAIHLGLTEITFRLIQLTILILCNRLGSMAMQMKDTMIQQIHTPMMALMSKREEAK
jgi:hypothetical protein